MYADGIKIGRSRAGMEERERGEEWGEESRETAERFGRDTEWLVEDVKDTGRDLEGKEDREE
jgi:hypothetical protein